MAVGSRLGCAPLLEVIEAVRAAVGPDFPVGVKLDTTDPLEGSSPPTTR